MSKGIFSVLLVCALASASQAQEMTSATSDNIKGLGYANYRGKIENTYLFTGYGISGHQLLLINDDLTLHSSRELIPKEQIEKAQYLGIFQIGDAFYGIFAGLSKSDSRSYALYAGKVLLDNNQWDVIQIAEFSPNRDILRTFLLSISENKEYFSVAFFTSLAYDYEYDVVVLNSSLEVVQQHKALKGEHVNTQKLRSIYTANNGDLFCIFDDAIGEPIAREGLAPIGHATIQHFMKDGETLNYPVAFEAKNCIGLELTSRISAAGSPVLNLFWFSDENKAITGWSEYELLTKKQTIRHTFDPAFAEPYRSIKALTIEEGSEEGNLSCHFFMREKWRTKIAGDEVIILEKYSEHLNGERGTSTSSGSLLIYRFDENGEVVWKNSINRLMQGGNGNVVFKLVKNDLYILFYDRIKNAGSGKDNVIYQNNDLYSQWAVFLAKIDLENNEKAITNVETATGGFGGSSTFVVPASLAFDGDNSLLAAKGYKLIKINIP